MIEEQALVIEIKGDILILQAQVQTACGNCSASKGCGTSVLSKVVGRKFTQFQAHNNINAQVGDTVAVGIKEDALVKGSVMMYIMPVLGMFASALLADYFLAETIAVNGSAVNDLAERDIMIAMSAIAGLATGSMLSRSYFRRQSATQQFEPVVLRKII